MTTHQVHPFHPSVDEADSADLLARLRATRLPVPLPGTAAGWAGGVPVEVLRELVQRWQEFDLTRYLDQRVNLPQVVTEIDGQRIHAVHVRSTIPGATPLVLVHGWPGSYLELTHLVGPLTDPVAHGGVAADAFDVVIPSLPGFGWSTPVTEGDWTTERIAGTLLELMTRLGHDRFVAQGGDIGAGVAPEMGRQAPDRVIGVHVNGALGGFVAQVTEDELATMTPLEQDRMRRVGEFMEREYAYIALQSTRPALLGAMLTDSPVGQLAWMLDKLQAWTHPAEADATDVLGVEWVLANASLSWFTRSAGSAAWVGYAQDEPWGEEPAPSGVPTAALQLAHDVGIRRFAERSNRIVRWTDVDRGGHFAALEEPELLVDDLRGFVASLDVSRGSLG